MTEYDADERWRDEWMALVYQAGVSLTALNKRNPWPNIPLLPEAMKYLMTELWDRGFSQTEITETFNEALENLPRYAAGVERRS